MNFNVRKTVQLMLPVCLLFVLSSSVHAQQQPEILDGLRAGAKYVSGQPVKFPDFTYQPASAPELLAIKKKYNLDSIAGKGGEVEQAKRLLKWFHNKVPHNDGPNIPVLNANTIIDSYVERRQYHGCYPLAIAMNEVFLAAGFKSRVVICFSDRYPEPKGGHVINTVYMPSLKKWVYMDPQDNAWITDENHQLLSIAEVRERLIQGKFLQLNDDANYHDVKAQKEDYLYTFMAEHLYRMICPLHSEYDSQTRKSGKTITYVELLPYGSIDPTVDGFETNYNKEKNTQVITYHTNDANVFWKLPE